VIAAERQAPHFRGHQRRRPRGQTDRLRRRPAPPIGFELAPEGVYLSQEPNLCLLVDDNNDDRADRMEILMHGFDTHDTHHAISAYCADASGAFYLAKAASCTRRSRPRTARGAATTAASGASTRRASGSSGTARPTTTTPGASRSITGNSYISDASDGLNWWGLPLSAKMPFGIEIPKTRTFVPKRSRPTSGSEFVSSRHFPDAMQGQFMICNSIGFLGISLASVAEDGAGFQGKLAGDLVSSTIPTSAPSTSSSRPMDRCTSSTGTMRSSGTCSTTPAIRIATTTTAASTASRPWTGRS
jgi:hypothetical protein